MKTYLNEFLRSCGGSISALIDVADGSFADADESACIAKATYPPAVSFFNEAANGPAFLLVKFL